jgi:hypothetical protein
MPTHTGGNDRSGAGTYAKSNLKHPSKAMNNSRNIEDKNVERDVRRENRERLTAMQQLEDKTMGKVTPIEEVKKLHG